jgi:bis(5'-nucleosyl)-tetraphosphatase (symmetrical)
MATFAIGDIQGCWDTLERLLERIDYKQGRDRLLLVGDLVNRGPKSLEVLRWAVAQGSSVEAVLGNHDLHLIGRHIGFVGPKKRDTLEDVLRAPDRAELVDWLRARPFLIREGEYTIVHAGLLPSWSPEQAADLAREVEEKVRSSAGPGLLKLTREKPGRRWDDALSGDERWSAIIQGFTLLRTCWPDGTPCLEFSGAPIDAPSGCRPWFTFETARRKSSTVVFGHWAALGLYLGKSEVGLDTGAIWGNALTAMRLEDRAVYHEKARERR